MKPRPVRLTAATQNHLESNDFRWRAGNAGSRSGFWKQGNRVPQEVPKSVDGKIKEAAGYVKEEAFEHGKSPDAKEKAQEGRDLRNEGRVEDGKAPKTTTPGTGAE